MSRSALLVGHKGQTLAIVVKVRVRVSYIAMVALTVGDVVSVRFTTIPSRTKGRRKVQIRLGNCRALQAPLAGPPPPPPVTTTSSSSAAAAVAVVGRGESGAHSEISLTQKSV